MQPKSTAIKVVLIGKSDFISKIWMSRTFLQVPYTWYTIAANHKLNTIKKLKWKHRTYLIFYFEIPYSLYTRTFAETLSTKAAVNFQNILHFFFSLSKKINHSVNYIVLLSSLAGVRPRSCSLANHYSRMLLVLPGPLGYKLSKECLHLISSEVPPGGYDSINFHKLL